MRLCAVFILALTACALPDDSTNNGASSRGDAGLADDGSGMMSDAGNHPAHDAGASQSTSQLVDQNCIDGRYGEVLPDPDQDIDDLIGSYSSGQMMTYIEGVLTRRFPLGWHLIDKGLEEGQEIGHCIDFFLRDRSSAGRVNEQLATAVHECGHFLDIARGRRGGDVYVVRPDYQITCQDGDSTDRFGNTFARSRINNDDYSRLRPPCNGARGDDCDSYADIYLDGNPDDGTFDGGDQGFNMLAEEALQYINSLATGYAFHDQFRFTVSERDGILTHLWWVQRYLAYARSDYPQAHEFLLGDRCWRELILTIWGRAWLYLDLTEDIRSLGIHDDALEDLVLDPNLLAEIEAVREAEGCR